MSVRVVAPCRLHFGLFHVPVDGLTHHPDGRPVRKFGGLGMMIETPCVTVAMDRAEPTSVSGTLSDRALEFLDRVQECGYFRGGWTLSADGPTEHVGLGVGTALGMAVSWAMFSPAQNFEDMPQIGECSMIVGRGRRSGIGVQGFMGGGFLLDDGKEAESKYASQCQRFSFPADWRIVLVRPPLLPVWHGDRERSAFARTRPADRALSLTERLRTLAYDTVVPAVRSADFDTFAQSLFEFNRLAGEPFHDDQGGPYAGAEVACVIDELMEMGAVGVGQSSWGPTVFAMCRDADEAERLAAKARARFSSDTDVTITAANNTGARVETL
jgi:beta-ribofuranosylaminobenzene 5'-phosphate synthase